MIMYNYSSYGNSIMIILPISISDRKSVVEGKIVDVVGIWIIEK